MWDLYIKKNKHSVCRVFPLLGGYAAHFAKSQDKVVGARVRTSVNGMQEKCNTQSSTYNTNNLLNNNQ